MTSRELYLQGPGLALAISGGRVAAGYFRREYGEVAWSGGPPPKAVVDARFARLDGPHADPLIAGHYKLARWRVRVNVAADADAPDAPVAVRAHVQGPLGLPLVQSQILEPLVGFAAARAGLVLVPGALLLDDEDRGVLIVAGSGAGKTTLVARALAAGRAVLADDRVFLDASGTATSFARRMRLYPDIGRTAPEAWAALGRGTRARLRGTAALRRLSAGRVAPHVAVARRELAAGPPLAATPVARVLLLRRHDGSEAQLVAASGAVAADEIQLRVRDDRGQLEVPELMDELGALAQRDRGVLEAAIQAATIQRLEIPAAWPAARAVGRLAAELGLA